MADVFISYSRADQEQVSRLAMAIQREGYSVWWDKELPPHLSYGDVITEKIAQAKAAVVVWSPTAAKSEWVRAEADMARNQKKLVQTALGDVMPPLPFNQIQYADIGDWRGEADHSGWSKVKVSLADLCGPRDGATPQPSVTSAPVPPPPPPPRQAEPASAYAQPAPSPKWPFFVAGGAVLLVVAAAGAFMAGQTGQSDDVETEETEAEPADSGTGDFNESATISDPDGYTNVRSSGSTSASIVGTLQDGERFRTFRQPGNWWRVQLSDGTIGYVARSRIVLAGEQAAPAAAAPAAAAPPAPEPAAARADMTFPDSSTRRLTEAEVYPLGPATLRYARNEIYARKGRRFKDPELRAYFGQFAWYRPVTDEVSLNPVEQANVALLQQAEDRYGQ
ncbi:YARHG domain-containing protein [Parerythrobacter lacustris]|uniref:YARHG domain-containing protein n=1 Tax=Parerythrobacter lacustris TaxID=2969984 RepID=A0ABT1XSG0_9SPHN|nr:YARHG domain-containing protein [Parerythrobacter lacustris]MCR2834157.1 YARHG domain-containing protein [Parerythrobacter lacustris]